MRQGLSVSSLIIALLTSFLISSCETDVDLIAPYKTTPVIVGILDYTADTQFVRINRTFLGEGDANAYAQIKDSVEYDPSEVEAWLVKLENGNEIDSIELQYIVLPSRQPGAFYNQNVGFYYTDQPLFTSQQLEVVSSPSQSGAQYQYKLNVVARGERFSAITDFPSLRIFDIRSPRTTNAGNRFKMEFYRAQQNAFVNFNFVYNYNSKTARYLGTLRLIFDYVTTDGTVVTDQFIDYRLGARDNLELGSGEASFQMNGRNWYDFIGPRIKAIPNIAEVQIQFLEFRLTGANEELSTYLSVAQPISDFTPVLTTYSNLSNGALGILGSRAQVAMPAELTEASLSVLNTYEATTGPNYCVQDWPGSSFLCSE